MRMITIGYPLPNANVDNHSVLNAPSLTDYEAVFVDPEGVTGAVQELLAGERDFTAHDGRPVINGASTAASLSAADQLHRRVEEAERFLDQGGTVVILGRPNATISGVIGFEGCDRYSWLPAPEGGSWGPPHLRAAEGKTIRIVDDDHPLSAVIREYRRNVVYRAVLNPRFLSTQKNARLIAVGGADLPIAAEIPVLAGRVVVIPVFNPVNGAARAKLAQAMVEAVAEVAEGGSVESVPTWARSLALPGSEQIEAELEDAETTAAQAAELVTSARERLDALTSHRRLLWASGRAFAEAVREGLALLGLTPTTGPIHPLAIEGSRTALVEVESSREAVAEWPYVRLQRRLERHLLDEGEQLKGLIVVNGRRAVGPASRKEPMTDALRIACENYGYSLITGETLFALVQRALGAEQDDFSIEAAGSRLLDATGLVDTERALGETEETSGDPSIF